MSIFRGHFFSRVPARKSYWCRPAKRPFRRLLLRSSVVPKHGLRNHASNAPPARRAGCLPFSWPVHAARPGQAWAGKSVENVGKSLIFRCDPVKCVKSGICKSSEGLHLWNSAIGTGLDPVNGVQTVCLKSRISQRGCRRVHSVAIKGSVKAIAFAKVALSAQQCHGGISSSRGSGRPQLLFGLMQGPPRGSKYRCYFSDIFCIELKSCLLCFDTSRWTRHPRRSGTMKNLAQDAKRKAIRSRLPVCFSLGRGFGVNRGHRILLSGFAALREIFLPHARAVLAHAVASSEKSHGLAIRETSRYSRQHEQVRPSVRQKSSRAKPLSR